MSRARSGKKKGLTTTYHLQASAVALVAVHTAPPVAHSALRVEVAAEAVEAVAQLVADHRAERPVLHGQVRLDVQQRGLQKAHGDDHLVGRGVVVRVDGVRHAQRLRLPEGVLHVEVEVGAAAGNHVAQVRLDARHAADDLLQQHVGGNAHLQWNGGGGWWMKERRCE
jgi:hypothetical protein